MKVTSLSHVRLLATPWIAAYQVPPSMAFSRQEYWSGVPLPSLAYVLLPANPLSVWKTVAITTRPSPLSACFSAFCLTMTASDSRGW